VFLPPVAKLKHIQKVELMFAFGNSFMENLGKQSGVPFDDEIQDAIDDYIVDKPIQLFHTFSPILILGLKKYSVKYTTNIFTICQKEKAGSSRPPERLIRLKSFSRAGSELPVSFYIIFRKSHPFSLPLLAIY
jgi:hypothetical protein